MSTPPLYHSRRIAQRGNLARPVCKCVQPATAARRHIAQNTEYVLLDEPLNNLDMKHSVQIMQVLKRMVSDLDKTIVLVLHDINFASCYSDYIVALKNGKVVKEGPTDDIISTPVLQDIYDLHIPIHQVDGNKICVYFK